MNDALLSILCEPDYWHFDPLSSTSIRFNQDVTGELWCMRETTFIFAVNMDWQILPLPESGEGLSTLGITSWWSRKPHVLGKLALQIKLNTTVAKSLVGPLPDQSNELYLHEPALRPRQFKVTIERGNFAPKLFVGIEGNYRHRFGLRLLFDESPVPLREGFKAPDDPPVSAFKFDEMDMFAARALPQSATRSKAMNDKLTGSTGGWTVASLARWWDSVS